ncbi:MAG: HU family DNA-binding protein [Prevotella sp.]|nr:HU family DNA-binding protein [Prevotella sp.]
MTRNTELARAISEKFGLSAKESESFVSTMIDIMNDALRFERQVKIKGLGTFKLLGVESRESVDVNTGKRITIGERDKITFTPDVVLRDRVNSPFSQFETFVINDDVDFSEIDNRYSGDGMEEKDNAVGDNESEDVQQETMDTPAVEPVVVDTVPTMAASVESEHLFAADVDDLEQTSSSSETVEVQPVVSPIVGEHDAESEEMKDEGETAEEKQNEENNLNNDIMYDEEFLRKNASQLNTQLDKLNDQLTANIERNNMVIKLLSAFVVLLLLALGAGIYYFTHQLALRDNYIHQLETIAVGDSTVTVEEKALTTESDSTAKAVDDNKAQPSAAPAKDAESQPKAPVKEAEAQPKASASTTETKPAPATAEKPAAPKEEPKVMSQYDSDPRIRLGAYDIVGVATTVTVQQGQTLQSISKAHLGPGMECYVEAINGVKEAKVGTKLKIPKLQLKKKKK